jgi:hypothetical protein
MTWVSAHQIQSQHVLSHASMYTGKRVTMQMSTTVDTPLPTCDVVEDVVQEAIRPVAGEAQDMAGCAGFNVDRVCICCICNVILAGFLRAALGTTQRSHQTNNKEEAHTCPQSPVLPSATPTPCHLHSRMLACM